MAQITDEFLVFSPWLALIGLVLNKVIRGGRNSGTFPQNLAELLTIAADAPQP